jgi:RES domain-containing protein
MGGSHPRAKDRHRFGMDSELQPITFAGRAFRSVPETGPFDPEALVSDDGATDRWNRPGEPTLYLALDLGVAVAEAGRHLATDGNSQGICHRIMQLTVTAQRIVDLRQPASAAAAGLSSPVAILDRATARTVAARLRDARSFGGILVPSAAFLDDPARANLVLFMEASDGIRSVIDSWEQVGRLELPAGQRGR